MTKTEIEQIAVEVVQKFLAEWQDTDQAQIAERDGEYVLIIKSINTRKIEAALHINLQKTVEKILSAEETLYSNHESDDGEWEPTDFRKLSAIEELTQVASISPDLLLHFFILLNIVSLKNRATAMFGTLSQEAVDESVRFAETAVQQMLRKWGLIAETRPGARSVISDGDAIEAILNHERPVPSQNQLAAALGTTPTAVRNWVRRKGFNSLNELVEHLLARARDDLDKADTEAPSARLAP